MLPQKEEVSPFPTNIRDVSFNNFWLEAIILLFSIMKNFIEINFIGKIDAIREIHDELC